MTVPDIIDWSNSGGKTALHIACQSGNAELVRTLCELGADLDLTDVQGNTPLHYASAWNALPCVRELLEAGCQHAARNNAGFTALEYAYSASMRRDFEALLKDIGAERRQQRRTLVGDALTLADGASGTSDLAARRFQQLRGRSSFGTFTSEDSGATNSPAVALSQSRAYAHLRPSVSASTSGSALSSGTASPARAPISVEAHSPLQRQQAMPPPQLHLTPAPVTPRSENGPASPIASPSGPLLGGSGSSEALPVVSVSPNATPMTPSRYQRHQQEQLGIRNRERANSGGVGGALNGKTSSPALMQRSRETSPEPSTEDDEDGHRQMQQLSIDTSSTPEPSTPMSPTFERLQGGPSARVASSSTIGTIDTVASGHSIATVRPGRSTTPHRTNSDSTASSSPTPIAPAQPRFSLSLAPPPARPERSQRRPSAGSSRASSPGSTVRNGMGVSPASSTLTLNSDAGGRTSFESFDSRDDDVPPNAPRT